MSIMEILIYFIDPNKKGPLYLLSHLRHEPSPKKKNNKLELGV